MTSLNGEGCYANFLTDPLVRVRLNSGEVTPLSFPSIFTLLLRDEIDSFPALRPHQRHVLHAFIVQLGALALLGASETELDGDTDLWLKRLRGLTAIWTDDEPWCLVSPLSRPALLQPPVPEGSLDGFKLIATSDELDMLITSKNHDLKASVASAGGPEDWFFALLSLQTQEGFLGAGNYGISRMNGGFANRPGLGIAPPGGPGARVRRDISVLIATRKELLRGDGAGYSPTGGLGLDWLAAWDGTESLDLSNLDPWHIEICRRVRVERVGANFHARGKGTSAARIDAKMLSGVTGDPWAPLVIEKDKRKMFSVSGGGFGYRKMVQLLFDTNAILSPPMQRIAETDNHSGLDIIARGLARGQGKTEGFHERRVPVSAWINKGWSRQASDPVAQLASARVANAGEVARSVRFALSLLVEPDRQQGERMKPQTEKAIQPWVDRFDLAIDRTFFSDMEREVVVLGDEAAASPERDTWLIWLQTQGLDLIEDAAAALGRGGMRRLRAIVRAKGAFSGLFFKTFPHLRAGKDDERSQARMGISA
jgi:CRISPR system Cascade subunit CasA